eukprot:6262092-Pyramimonas_sp.AAC.1
MVPTAKSFLLPLDESTLMDTLSALSADRAIRRHFCATTANWPPTDQAIFPRAARATENVQ